MNGPAVEIIITISLELGIDAVRSGRRDVLGDVLESYRPYLSEIARTELSDDMKNEG